MIQMQVVGGKSTQLAIIGHCVVGEFTNYFLCIGEDH